MRLRSGVIVVAMFAGLCPSVNAQNNDAAAKILFVPSWSADVPGGKIQRIRLPVNCSRQLSLFVRMNNTNLDQGGTWIPAISIQLWGEAFDAPLDNSAETVALQLLGRPDGSRSSFIFFKGENGTRGEALPAGSASFGEDVEITLSWNEKNEVTAKVGTDEPVTIAMKQRPASIGFSVSGAIAIFHDIRAEFPDVQPGATCTEFAIKTPP